MGKGRREEESGLGVRLGRKLTKTQTDQFALKTFTITDIHTEPFLVFKM